MLAVVVLDSTRREAREWGFEMRPEQLGKTVLLISVALLFAAGTALSQDKPVAPGQPGKSPSQPSSKKQSAAPRDSKKTSLDDPTRVSSSEKAPSDDAVVEFHPAPPADGKQSDPAASPTKSSKKPTLDKVHGTVYGATGAQGGPSKGDRAGGNGGVTSKSGKTSIYVQTEHSRETASPPH